MTHPVAPRILDKKNLPSLEFSWLRENFNERVGSIGQLTLITLSYNLKVMTMIPEISQIINNKYENKTFLANIKERGLSFNF